MLDVLHNIPASQKKKKYIYTYESNTKDKRTRSIKTLWNNQGRKWLLLKPFVDLLWQFTAITGLGVKRFLILTARYLFNHSAKHTAIFS